MPTFNTLEYTEELEAAGVPPSQAKAHAKALLQIIDTNLATKADIAKIEQTIKELETSTNQKIKELETSLKHDIELLRTEIKAMEQRLTIRLGGMLIIGIGAVATLIKLL